MDRDAWLWVAGESEDSATQSSKDDKKVMSGDADDRMGQERWERERPNQVGFGRRNMLPSASLSCLKPYRSAMPVNSTAWYSWRFYSRTEKMPLIAQYDAACRLTSWVVDVRHLVYSQLYRLVAITPRESRKSTAGKSNKWEVKKKSKNEVALYVALQQSIRPLPSTFQ